MATKEGESTNGAVFLIVTDMVKAKKWKEEEVSQLVNKDMACLYIFASRCIRLGHATIGRLATRVPSSSGHGTIAGNALRREQSPDGVCVDQGAESVSGAFPLARVVTGVGQCDGAQCFVARRDSRRGCVEDCLAVMVLTCAVMFACQSGTGVRRRELSRRGK